MIGFNEFQYIFERTYGGTPAGEYDFLDLDVSKARSIASAILSGTGITVSKKYPKFDINFNKVKVKLSKSLGTERKDMPVIASWQVDDFKNHLTQENIKSFYKYQEVDDLKPIQGQIYFDKIIAAEIKYGAISHTSENVHKTIITSRDGYIIDGHHRWVTAMMNDTTIKLKTLVVDMGIHELLTYARNYGLSIGNEANK